MWSCGVKHSSPWAVCKSSFRFHCEVVINLTQAVAFKIACLSMNCNLKNPTTKKITFIFNKQITFSQICEKHFLDIHFIGSFIFLAVGKSWLRSPRLFGFSWSGHCESMALSLAVGAVWAVPGRQGCLCPLLCPCPPLLRVPCLCPTLLRLPQQHLQLQPGLPKRVGSQRGDRPVGKVGLTCSLTEKWNYCLGCLR